MDCKECGHLRSEHHICIMGSNNFCNKPFCKCENFKVEPKKKEKKANCCYKNEDCPICPKVEKVHIPKEKIIEAFATFPDEYTVKINNLRIEINWIDRSIKIFDLDK